MLLSLLRTLFGSVLVLVAASSLHAQENDGVPIVTDGFGVYGDAAFIGHTADFRAIPGFPNCCPQFSKGSGTGPAFGAYYKFPFADQFVFYLRAGYYSYGATLTTREGTTVLDTNGSPQLGAFDHTVVASLGSVGIEPMFGFALLPHLNLRAGGRIGYVVTHKFSQKEVIAEPTNFGVFTDTHTRTRNVFNDETLPNASSLEAALLAGLSYEVPLNASGSLHAVPEAYYSLGLSQITNDLTWKANAFRAGLGIEYTPLPEPKPAPIAETPPPAPKKPPVLDAQISAVSIDRNGMEHPNAKITVEEFESARVEPLLNYIFFDEGSSQIADRYVRLTPQATKTFRVEHLYHLATLPTYYQVMNIVGRRLFEHPEATIMIVGCNSDEGKEKGDRALSKERANNIFRYLRDVWSIPVSRMKVDVRNLPENPSYVSDSDGVVENRRVEIQSTNWEIIQPVFTTDTILRVNPETIQFRPVAIAEAGVRDWKLAATRGDGEVRTFTGENNLPAAITWPLDSTNELLIRNGSGVSYSLSLTDEAGQHVLTPQSIIPIERVTIKQKRSERVADREIDHYSLILFDFDKASLSTSNQRISRYILEHTPPNATTSITGYTDRMGNDEHNQHLAIERAHETAKVLNVPAEQTKGVGRSQLLYDNSLPEGRFYCRTVKIDVERPVSN